MEIGRVWKFWPMAFVAVGLVKLLQPGFRTGRLAGLIFLGAGVLLLLGNFNYIRFEFEDMFPLFLVLLGGSMVWRALDLRRASAADSTSVVNAIAIMGGVARTSSAQDFRGGDLTAIMGGCEIDLRQASIAEGEAIIHIFAFWGGIEIKVPEDWTVESQLLPIMRGYEDSTRAPKEGFPKNLVVKGFAIMGGIEIHN